MSRNLLCQRLAALEHSGIIERKAAGNGRGHEYSLTAAGLEFGPVIDALGTWGYRWSTHDLTDEDLDPDHLIWVMRRLVRIENLPGRRVVVCFRFREDLKQRYWLVLNRPEVDVCLFDPGFEIDLEVVIDMKALAQICLGHLSVPEATHQGKVSLTGSRHYCRELSNWLGVTRFAAAAS